MATTTQPHIHAAADSNQREAVFDIFRRWGHLQATLDPLCQYLAPEPFPAPAPEGEFAAEARGFYCGSIGLEFMHIPNNEQRQWLQQQMEQTAPTPDQAHILSGLIRADIFEQTIQSRYLGTKRFSLEGLTVLIPFLDRVLASSASLGINTAVLAMSHRGRLNVMANTIGRSPFEIFARFEDVNPRSVLGGGDVKYHMGATGEYRSPDGTTISLHLVSNPSHLEAVDPVASAARAPSRHASASNIPDRTAATRFSPSQSTATQPSPARESSRNASSSARCAATTSAVPSTSSSITCSAHRHAGGIELLALLHRCRQTPAHPHLPRQRRGRRPPPSAWLPSPRSIAIASAPTSSST